MICIKCNSTEVVRIDIDTVKCNNCGYTLSVKLDDSKPVVFQRGEPHFDSRKYTCDPSWMEQVVGPQTMKKKSFIDRLKRFFKRLAKWNPYSCQS